MRRYCEQYIADDLKKKMVFLGGPRQVGKTTLSKNICQNNSGKHLYLNWDITEDQQTIIKKQWLSNNNLIIFDELHKYPLWKRWIKGVYDARPAEQQYLVTGSARLDVYKRGGDSLLGRYHYWRLHPFTIDEPLPNILVSEMYARLLTVGGFPEPFLNPDEREARRWRHERFARILQEDVRDLENIKNIQLLSLFSDALRARVGGLITLSNLARDLEISPKTAKTWLASIEKMYIAFAVYPLSRNVPRSILKPPKVYFFDNADVLNGDGAKLENLVATTLLKRLHFIEDNYGYRTSLHYIRDKDGREVDFAVLIDDKLEYLIEVKLNEDAVASGLKYYAEKLKPKNAVQIVGNLKTAYENNNILVINPCEFFTTFAPPPWINKDSDYGG